MAGNQPIPGRLHLGALGRARKKRHHAHLHCRDPARHSAGGGLRQRGRHPAGPRGRTPPRNGHSTGARRLARAPGSGMDGGKRRALLAGSGTWPGWGQGTDESSARLAALHGDTDPLRVFVRPSSLAVCGFAGVCFGALFRTGARLARLSPGPAFRSSPGFRRQHPARPHPHPQSADRGASRGRGSPLVQRRPGAGYRLDRAADRCRVRSPPSRCHGDAGADRRRRKPAPDRLRSGSRPPGANPAVSAASLTAGVFHSREAGAGIRFGSRCPGRNRAR